MAEQSGKISTYHRGIELEKFKRRMIRSVARKMKEKKQGDEMWLDMKKEIGSNCKKLWERMRMLTLKKLKRLLEADDRVDQIGPVARMTLTDWLLFDLVIVHEKIDVIDRERLTGDYNSKVLNNLFALVQRFQIEQRVGENLAEAWTAATVYYNSKGHQCSPMMLQRRWYQIKELTRHKFYKFWFNYRGNQRQLGAAKQDSPDALQKAIALMYPHIITEKFMTWEERIENRVIILPDELGVKMRQRNLMKASDTTAPDVVLVEPQIEIIDLEAYSDSDEEPSQNEQTNDETRPPVRIKSEPVDTDENIDQYQNPPEKKSVFDEEIERLQMVEEHFEKEKTLQNNEKLDSILIEPDPANDAQVDSDENETPPIVDDDDAIVILDEQDDEPVEANDDKHIDVPISKDCNEERIQETIDREIATDITVDEAPIAAIAEISSVRSAGIKVENMDDVVERTENESDQVNQSNTDSENLPVILTVSSAGVKVETDLAVCDDNFDMGVTIPIVTDMDVTMPIETHKDVTMLMPIETDKDVIMPIETDMDVTMPIETHVDVTMPFETAKDSGNVDQNDPALPVISNISSKGVKVEIEIDKLEKPQAGESQSERSVKYSVPSKDVDALEGFDIPMDLDFADDDINFADDGIAYVEEDEDDIIKVIDTFPQPIKDETEKELKRTLKESQDDGSSDTEKEQPQFDLKLLMCPVVYTTRLDNMLVFDDDIQVDHVSGKEEIDKIYTLSKPISVQAVAAFESIEPELEVETSNILTDHQDKNTALNVCDDDLFREENTDSLDSDSEEEVIDDSKRVKMTSYMLRKPKYRSYNPVTLCKNPDFNTRLKKLSVGFFMSARNRMLLQSCIPMTIDLNKVFEDKLINGTLYLKDISQEPIDKIEPVIEINDDVDVLPADLVKPTAVQQSLMHIDETLENELVKRMAERVRAINLPDISQVRRLNQHLLTAEVTPQRLNSQTTHTEDSATYVQNIKNDIDNLLSQHQTNQTSCIQSADGPSPVDTDTPQLRNNPMLLKQLNPTTSSIPKPTQPMVSIPSPTVRGPDFPLVYFKSVPFSDVPSVSHNTGNPPGLNKDKNADIGKAKPRKPVRKKYYPTLAWNQRPLQQNQAAQDQFHPDALLTIDTLYKMLSALDPCLNLEDSLPKKKIVKKKLTEVKSKNKREVTSDENNTNQNNMVIDITDDKPAKKINKREVTSVENNTNQNTVIDITEDKPAKKLPGKKPKAVKPYCCFLNFKFYGNSLIKRRHRCKPNNCSCCCKRLYPSIYNSTYFAQAVSENVSDTIEHVVQQTMQPQTSVTESIQVDLDDNDDYQLEPLVSDKAVIMKTSDEVLENIRENVLANSQETAAELTQISPVKTPPIPRLRVYSGSAIPSQRKTQSTISLASSYRKSLEISSETEELNLPLSSQAFSDTTEENNRNRGEGDIPNSELLKHDGEPMAESHVTVKSSYKTYESRKLMNQPKTISCSCRPNISNVNQGRIEIDGSNNCVLHKKQAREHKKQVILNKKIVNDENQPFFVGKGKILLTNVKMPNKDNLSALAPKVQNITLPAGVQIVLLPDQTLTYIVAPGVTLSLEEYALLPQFLVAVQQQINALGIAPPPLTEIKANEIVDQDKDETKSNIENSTAANDSNVASTAASTEDVSDSTERIIPVTSHEEDHESTQLNQLPREEAEIESDNATKEQRENEGIMLEVINKTTIPDLVKNVDENSAENPEYVDVTDQVSEINMDIDEPASDQNDGEASADQDAESTKATSSERTEVTSSEPTVVISSKPIEDDNFEPNKATSFEPTGINSSEVTGITSSELTEVVSPEPSEATFPKPTGAISSEPTDATSPEQITEDNLNKKSLLSDLMEMSGIMEEDLAPVSVQVMTPQEPIILDTSNLVLQQEVALEPVPVEPESPPKEYYKAKSKNGEIELMAVTSFTQLKYSSDNQGLFFKLDLESGQLTSINVRIQKFPQLESAPKSDKVVIDLTDDPDVSITGTTELKSTPKFIIDRKLPLPAMPKLTKISSPKRNPQLMSTILQKKKKLMKRLSNNLKPANIPQSKMQVVKLLNGNKNLLRKPEVPYYSKFRWNKMKKVDTKINLVDSDTPMEEEYLCSSDSSDDEPLIHKAKRMRAEETLSAFNTVLEQGAEQEHTTPGSHESSQPDPDNLEELENEQADPEDGHVEELVNKQVDSQNTHATEEQEELIDELAPLEQDTGGDDVEQNSNEDYLEEEHLENLTEDDASQTSITQPVPTNLLLSGGAFNSHNIPLNYIPKENEEDDDNCILGV